MFSDILVVLFKIAMLYFLENQNYKYLKTKLIETLGAKYPEYNY
jgi:hypothetical protein